MSHCERKHPHGSWRYYLIATAFAVTLFAFNEFNLFNFHELNAVDLRLKLRGEKPADPRIVVVEIDDASLKIVGQWPWPRGVDGALLSAISRYEPRLILLDLLFTEPSPSPMEDVKLAFAVKNAGNVILPFYFYSEKPFGAFFPIQDLRNAVKNIGFVNVDSERDGIFRKFKPYIRAETEEFFPSAPLALFLESYPSEMHERFLAGLPLDNRGQLWINFPGSVKSFKRITAWEVFEGVEKKAHELEELFRNNFVFIGHTATATSDLKPAPFSPLEPGVALHASAFHTLLSGRFLRTAPPLANFLILLALLMLVTFISQTESPQKSILMNTGIWLGYIAINLFAFNCCGVILHLYLPLTGMILVYVFMLFLKYVDIRFQEELLNRELRTAAQIQESFLPKSDPPNPSIDAAFECRFAKQVGGDLYDWFEQGGRRLAVCVGDVSGKGCPAALYMARAMNELRHEHKDGQTPGELNTILNTRLSKGETSGMFLTLFYAVIDPENKKISFSNAGHEPLIYYSADSRQTTLISEAQGTPLGLFEEAVYETADIAYKPGDMIVVISDGVKELRNAKKEQFGMKRLETLIKNCAARQLGAKQTINAIFQALDDFRKRIPPHDDRTILCVKL